MRKAAILAVGSELTQGQVVNSNAGMISQWLVDCGFHVAMHYTVPDEECAILDALTLCGDAADHIFVTGGLGPTSDDFTRNVVAKWLGEPLVFDDSSWTRCQELIARRGIALAPANRQQCYFPRNADILPNAIGTADAFLCRTGSKILWVLPGPPDEIKVIWQQHVGFRLAGLIPADERVRLHLWSCMGISEAELGERVHNALLGCPYTVGYRAHSPLIEVKLWIPSRDESAGKIWLEKIEKTLEPWVVSMNGDDLAQQFLGAIPSGISIDVHDLASGGLIASRLAPLITAHPDESYATRFSIVTQWDHPVDLGGWTHDVLKLSDPGVLTLAVCGPSPRGEWTIGRAWGEATQIASHNLGLKGDLLKKRGRRYLCELAFIKWREMLLGNA